MITAGMDVGAKTFKVVILKDGQIVGKGIAAAGLEADGAIRRAWEIALKEADISGGEVDRVFATGSRRTEIKGYDDEVSEVVADARGMYAVNPDIKTFIDVGAEEGRAVKVNPEGRVLEFAVNEKCAAGAGAFIEAMARAMQVSIEEFGALALQGKQQIPINAQCVIFAESEVVSLVHEETGRNEICKAVNDAISERLTSMARRVRVEPPMALIGGAARNLGLQSSIKQDLDLDDVYVPEDPEFLGAYGAALIAGER
ncbi:MAG: acyl-CoA dehydratase activase [Pseudomonadota bacterium]